MSIVDLSNLEVLNGQQLKTSKSLKFQAQDETDRRGRRDQSDYCNRYGSYRFDFWGAGGAPERHSYSTVDAIVAFVVSIGPSTCTN